MESLIIGNVLFSYLLMTFLSLWPYRSNNRLGKILLKSVLVYLGFLLFLLILWYIWVNALIFLMYTLLPISLYVLSPIFVIGGILWSLKNSRTYLVLNKPKAFHLKDKISFVVIALSSLYLLSFYIWLLITS
jgi:hypothetical protein